MAKFKTIVFVNPNIPFSHGSEIDFSANIKIDEGGMFYCNVPVELDNLFEVGQTFCDTVFCKHDSEKNKIIKAKHHTDLEEILKKATENTFSVDVKINASGMFYCDVPLEFNKYYIVDRDCYGSTVCEYGRGKKKIIKAQSFADLKTSLDCAMKHCFAPTVTTEYVIRFNIKSQASFAVNDHGEISRNASADGFKWQLDQKENMFGNLSSINEAKGGYSLTIGAKALIKTTTVIGQNKTVTYAPYYKDSTHHHMDANPATKLNSWCSFTLPEDAREIPYSDEAAIFFDNLMFSMVKLSKLIQDASFKDDELVKLIQSGCSNLLAPPKQ